jgi:hypothetical protein
VAGGIGVAAAVVYRALRPQQELPAPPSPSPDPRAEALRDRIAESRTMVEEREEFESAETTVDQADPAALDERRRHVHERGQAALDRMRGPTDESS